MLRVFLSSTFRDLKGERRELLDQLDKALKDVGMEDFIPDGRKSQEIALENIIKSDVVIFLISPYYGTLMDECRTKNCKSDCPVKDGSNKISYTHCEYKFALAENKLHQAYLVDKDWEITSKLKDWDEIDWEKIHDDPILKDIPREELKHFFKVAKNVSKFKEEAESELCPRINGIDRIVSDLADNIANWYSERKLNLEDFYGRRRDLKHLLKAMEEGVEVYGVGGVGKTCMIQLALLIQKLKGKKIITISTGQSYFSGSGYKPFKDKCAEGLHEIIGNKITLDDVADALGIQEELISKNTSEKTRIILAFIQEENIHLFIDDFHLSDEDVKQLVKYASSGLVLASKRKIGYARGEIHLSGIEKEDRYEFIDRSALRFDKKLDDKARNTICQIAEGHPVSTEILVRNYEKIDFDRLKSFKQSLESSNPDHAEELMRREVKEILKDDAFSLLRKLALINTELENDIDLKIIVKIQGKVSEAVFHELIDTGMLDKKNTSKAAYHFSYKHIQDVVKDDKKEYHKWAINYYSNKIRDCGKTCADQIELLFHQSMSNPKEKHVDAFLDLCGRVGPGQFGFARLIEAGEKLRPCFNKDERIYASLIGSIAVLYHKLTRFESAEEHYKEALKIYRALAGRNPDAFNSDLAMTLNNLAGLYKDLRNFESAEEHYKEALKIYRALARRNPDAFNSDLAETLNGYGNLYRELKKFEEANKFYSEAFELYQCMAKKSPYAFEHFLVRIKADISRLYIDSGKESEGITCLNDCLKRNDLLPDLGAESFAALGAAQERLQNAKEAAENYLSAASTYFILFKKGVRCLDEIMKDLQKVKELGDGETKGDTEMMLTAMKRLKGEETAIPEVELSKRGMALKDALERKAAYSEFQPESVIDDMILILIKDLSESNLRS